MEHSLFDMVIIGAGPSGLSVAIEAHKAGLKYCVIEKGGIVNSIQRFPTEMTFFSTPELLEIGGIPFTSSQMRPTRAEGLEYYTRVAEFFSLELRLYEAVHTVTRIGKDFSVDTALGTYRTRNIVVATGYFDNPNYLNVPGEELPKVSHYYGEAYPYFRQRVAVIGGKNSAAIAALDLFRHGATVTLIHRGEQLSETVKYWIRPDIENRIKEGSILALFNATVTQIHPASLSVRQDGRSFDIKNDFVFALTGYHPEFRFLDNIGIELDAETLSPVHSSETFETKVEGMFVAGSVVAGRNNNNVFIENGRNHGRSIVRTVLSRIRSAAGEKGELS